MNFVLDTHCHTVSSGHAYSTLKECLEEASRKRLRLLAVTEHAPAMQGAPSPLYFGNMRCLPEYVNGVRLLCGIELNILDAAGAVDLDTPRLSKLDIVIASLHPPVFTPADEDAHTAALISVMDNPYVHILGHLGDPRYPFDIERVVEHALKTNTIIELNNSSFNPSGVRAGGDETVKALVRRCIARGVKLVLASDAHFYADVGNFCYLKPLIADLEVPEELILNTSVEKLQAALNAKRGAGQ